MPTPQAAKALTSVRDSRVLAALGLLWAMIVLLQFGPAPATLDFDMFHEMSLAREWLSNGHFPYHDSFAYTPTLDPVIHHEWGMGLLLYAVGMCGGSPGLYVLLLLLVAGTIAACTAAAKRAGAAWPAIILGVLLAGPLGIVGFGAVRAQFITVLFLAILLLMLESDRRGGRAWMPVWLALSVAWVNLHGGFLVGLGVLALYWLETALHTRTWQPRLLLLLLASFALTGVSPYGYAHLISVIAAAFTPRPIIPEWGPLWTDRIRMAAFAASLLPVIYCLRKTSWKRLPGLLLLVVCALLALRHTRHSALYAVAWLCYVPAWFSATPAGAAVATFWMRRARVLIPMLLVFILLVLLPLIVRREFRIDMPTHPSDAAPSVVYPVGPVAYLARHHFRGNIMTPFEMGAFISWKLAPSARVSIDSRYEVAYSPSLAAEMVAFYDSPTHWRQTLDRYPPDLILTRNAAKVASLLATAPEWRRIYIDDVYSLYARPAIDLPVTDRRAQPLTPAFP